jgi:hypothetical protein
MRKQSISKEINNDYKFALHDQIVELAFPLVIKFSFTQRNIILPNIILDKASVTTSPISRTI